jgi:hypothetical protein
MRVLVGALLASIVITISASCGGNSNDLTASTRAATSTTVPTTTASPVLPTTTEAPSPSGASCAPEVLLPVVAGLFPQNAQWNPTGVTVDVCRGGYVQLVALLDQSACPTEGVDCRDNQQVWLKDVEGVWTFLDAGTGIGCQPEEVSPSIKDACAAFGTTPTSTT